MRELSLELAKLYRQWKQDNPNPNLSENEIFLYKFCKQFQLSGQIRQVAGKYYFIIKHPAVLIESQILHSDYQDTVDECVGYCDYMIQALLKNKDKDKKNNGKN